MSVRSGNGLPLLALRHLVSLPVSTLLRIVNHCWSCSCKWRYINVDLFSVYAFIDFDLHLPIRTTTLCTSNATAEFSRLSERWMGTRILDFECRYLCNLSVAIERFRLLLHVLGTPCHLPSELHITRFISSETQTYGYCTYRPPVIVLWWLIQLCDLPITVITVLSSLKKITDALKWWWWWWWRWWLGLFDLAYCSQLAISVSGFRFFLLHFFPIFFVSHLLDLIFDRQHFQFSFTLSFTVTLLRYSRAHFICGIFLFIMFLCILCLFAFLVLCVCVDMTETDNLFSLLHPGS